MRAAARAVPALLLAVALATGCSVGGSDDSGDLSVAAPPAMDGDAAAGGSGQEASGGGTGQVVDLRVAPGDAVIRTADLEVRVDDVRRAAEEAGRLARAAGGRVEGEDRSASEAGGSASLQLRVPPAAFDGLLADLSALGNERSRRQGTEDVGDQVVDLEARLATQRASVERVRALLASAKALGEVVQIESELTKRTADLESLEARLASLSGRVELATVTVRFDGDEGPVIGQALGFGDGLAAGWSAVTGVARALAVTTGALLPFLPLLLVAGWLVLRARSRRTAAPGGPATP